MINKLLHLTRTRLGTTDDQGATLVEYGMLVALIAAVCVGVVATLGTQISAAFTTIVQAL